MGPKYSEFNFNGGTIENVSKYWNGKVVCVEPGRECLTKGKVYSVENGELLDDNGCFVAQRPVRDFYDLADMTRYFATFIEYKGMA